MLGRLQEYKISDNPKTADVIIINTCGFIDAAKEESINTILTTHQERKKDSLLVVSGCLTERYREQLQRDLPEVDIFTGVGDYEQIDKMIAQKRGIFSPQVYLANESSERVITGSNRHAYIKMAEGCNQSCSFCAIPSFKGKLHSRTLLSIEKEVKALVSKGFYEFSFISQDSSSYGRDIGIKKDGLIDLINVVEKIDGVKVARILYLYPSTTTFKLIDTIANSNVFETYYDMPIQQIDDTMLKLMRRGFGEKKTIELLEHMKSKKDAFIRSSIIVGHPGESDRAFERVCTFLKEFKFDRVNLFFYSNEETTPAFTMKPVEEVIIEERIEVLEAIAKETTEDSLKMMLGKLSILF